MRKLFIQVVCLALFASPAFAQEAPLAAPITVPNRVSRVIGGFEVKRFPEVKALIQINFKDAQGNVLRGQGDYYNIDVPLQAGADAAHPTASIANFLNTIMSTQAGETGPVGQRIDFRVLTWLKAHGYLDDTLPLVP